VLRRKNTRDRASGANPSRSTQSIRKVLSNGAALLMQRRRDVQGSITSRDVFLHSFTILRLWGPAFYVRCIRAIASRRACTFLDVLAGER
jgi:hypothetical protein